MPTSSRTKKIRVAIIGDHNPSVTAHIANPKALELSAAAAGCALETQWLPTDSILQTDLSRFDVFWCVPSSPYRSMDGALHAIRFARENGRPFLGTCAGFQHALVEFARNIAEIPADFEETDPASRNLLISRLACSLVEKDETIRILPGTRLAEIYAAPQIVEQFHCNFGVNPAFREKLESAGISWTAQGAGGEVRAFELPAHPFFIGTLFQPERAALRGIAPPVVTALLRAAIQPAG